MPLRRVPGAQLDRVQDRRPASSTRLGRGPRKGPSGERTEHPEPAPRREDSTVSHTTSVDGGFSCAHVKPVRRNYNHSRVFYQIERRTAFFAICVMRVPKLTSQGRLTDE